MTLNFISNFAANQAVRFVNINSQDAANSVAKLASGSRVVNASDDVAALAIGSRLATEVAALQTAQVNAGQASSLLQIADGALSSIQDILTRAKTLAVQAGSQNLGDSERALIDTEFQNLLTEIDRISADTEFAGQSIINRDLGTGTARTLLGIEGQDGVINVAARQFNNKEVTDGGDGSFQIGFTAASDAGSNIVFNANLAAGSSGGSLSFSATITTDLIDNAGNTQTGALATGTTLSFVQDATQPAEATFLSQFSQDNAEFVLSLDASFNVASIFAAAGAAVSQGTLTFGNTTTTGPFQEFNFKVGSGIIPSEDNVEITLGGATTENLGINGLDVTTFSTADSTSQAVTQALDFVVGLRSDVGAATNQVESASDNLAVAIENTEAARSTLLDLDVASEIVTFTNEQILVQAGISVLAQANQLPQNLLRLFL